MNQYFDDKVDAFLGSAIYHITDLLDVAAAVLGGSDAAVSFWKQEASTPRIVFVGPTGSAVPEVVNALTGLSLREVDLRQYICEAIEPVAQRWLYRDGTSGDYADRSGEPCILQLHGERWLGTAVSGGLLNVNLPEGALQPAEWLERVTIPVVVTSARAALGLVESSLIRRMKKQKRFFVLLVTGIEGDEEQVAAIIGEIEAFKTKPFMEEAGPFSVAFCRPGRAWIDELSMEIAGQLGKSHCLQLLSVVQRWIDQWAAHVEQLWLEEEKKRAEVDAVRLHLADITTRLIDIARRIAAELSLDITDLYSALENTADKTAADFTANLTDPLESIEDLLLRLKKGWLVLDRRIAGAPDQFLSRVETIINREMDSFTESYSSVLTRDPVPLPELQPETFSEAFEIWQQMSLQKFVTETVRILTEIQQGYKKRKSTERQDAAEPAQIQDGAKNTQRTALWAKVLPRTGSPENSIEHEAASIITEMLRRYVRDRMCLITKAFEEDTAAWFTKALRPSLEVWRIAVNRQLDDQLALLKADSYRSVLLTHQDVWRRLSLEARTGI